LNKTNLTEALANYSDISEYFDDLVTVVRGLGKGNFEASLMLFLSKLVPIDHCTVFTYSNHGKAGHLFTHGNMPARESEILARDYVEKFHKKDPNFDKLRSDSTNDYYQFKKNDLAKDYDPTYQNHFFDRSGLIDKTSSIGKIEDGKIYCNFYRMNKSNAYSESEREILNKIMPLATALIAAHYELAHAKGDVFMDNGSENIVNKSIVHNVISNDLEPFNRLTKRERQVCERILLGYTSIGIGLDLNIAPTSVATYRKRAYSKLAISSQNELFTLCLRTSSSSTP